MFGRLKKFWKGRQARNSLLACCVAKVNEIDWLIPWHPVRDGTRVDAMVHELRSELCSDLVLFGIPVLQIGYRQDCDDALFHLLDGTNRLAVVHLTFALHPEPNPNWPETTIFENLQQFVRDEMLPANENWSTG